MRVLFILLVCYCCVCPYVLFAQKKQYQFSRLDNTNGLSHNQVNCIYKDATGFIWFGTMSGLNRFDGYGFKVFHHNIRDSQSIDDDFVRRIADAPENKMLVQTMSGVNIYDPITEHFINAKTYLDKFGLPFYYFKNAVKIKEQYWFAYADAGIFKIDAKKSTTSFKHIHGKANSIDSSFIEDIEKDSKNNLVVFHKNGILELFNTQKNEVVYRTSIPLAEARNQTYGYRIYVDNDDDIWLFTPSDNSGVFYVNAKTKKVTHLSSKNGQLNNDVVNGVVQDNKGKIWIGTDHGGVNIIDKKDFTSDIISNSEDDITSLAQNSIYALYKDNLGIVWAGTYKRGVCFYHESVFKFPLYRHKSSDINSLPYDDINRFVEDAKGNIWIGSNGGGLFYFDRNSNTYQIFRHSEFNSNSIANDVVVSLSIDHLSRLWIGYYFGGMDCYDGKNFIHYRHSETNINSLSDDRVWDIKEDISGTLWIATLSGGLDKYNPVTKQFTHYKAGAETGLHTGYLSSLLFDDDSTLWIATADGIDVMNTRTQKFIHYGSPSHPISNNNTTSFLKDHLGNIWISTRDGLNVFDKKSKTFQSFSINDGLPDNTTLDMLEDKDHRIWLSTPNGLSCITPRRDKSGYHISCKNYNELDGLQAKTFNVKASLKTSRGELLFGGNNGFNLFEPNAINFNTNLPQVAFTGFQLFNRTVNVGDVLNGHVILSESIATTKQITLRYDENIFTLEFAALSFANTEKNRYEFKLVGFDKDWQPGDSKSRKVTYTNLDPGEYTLLVKASNDDNIWNQTPTALKITILPPFWKTPLAYLLYMAAIAGILFLARKMIIERATMRFALAQERKEAQRMHELDLMKIKFFTNVSHEFRTPLSLILSPLDKIIRQATDYDAKKQLLLIHRNARRLLNLVNQLLDFRKMEVQELRLNPVKGEIIKFIKDISYSFTDIAGNKHIRFSFHASVPQLYTQFDQDKIERILFNLLSNAFKFTPENGSISVQVDALGTNAENRCLLAIKVIDTGIGIPAEKHKDIFNRFFQHDLPGTIVNQGSGIGLSITKEFVKLHNGNISVESEPDKGSCFTVIIPFIILAEADLLQDKQVLTPEEETDLFADDETNETATLPATVTPSTANKKPVILIVEDNEDFRFYLKDNLKEYYTIVEAGNGKEGWQKMLGMHPELVITDIGMPIMNGIELCKKIKGDVRTKQVPVILLTAFSGEEQQLQGLETGASDYMTKPFNFEIMLSRIRNLLSTQASFKKAFTRQVEIKPTEVAFESADEKFIQQALEIVEKHLSDTNFSVEELSRELFMSRVSVYKRIFALTGKTPIEFIRSIRITRAAILLEKSNLTVAQVAYEVGFNNPKYFTKYFKMAFNLVPTEYAAAKRKQAADKKKEG